MLAAPQTCWQKTQVGLYWMAEPWRASPGAEYIEGVLSGKIPVCRSIQQSVKRAVWLHKNAEQTQWIYKPGRAKFVIEYAKLCKLSSGRAAGQPFIHLPWQAFITGELFGWYHRKTDIRKYRVAFIEIPKKNGKSPYLALLGLIFFHAERKIGVEIHTLASKKDQARIIFNAARAMVRQSPVLRKEISVYNHHMEIGSKFAKFEPLSSDVDTIDGLTPYCQLVDELHRHKSRDLWDLARNAGGAFDDSVLIAITTAGTDVTSVCYEEHTHALNVLDGVADDETYFAYVATPDDGYDPRDESWLWKLNPSMGTALNADDVIKSWQKEIKRGMSNAFRRYRYNEWVRESKRWISADQLQANSKKVNVERLKGMRCFGGLDLALSVDMSAFTLLFEVGDLLVALVFYWCSEKSVENRVDNDRLPYDRWVQDGHLIQTPGSVTDFQYIEQDILKICRDYTVISVGYDPYRATQLASNLSNNGLEMVEVRQGTISLNGPMEYLYRKIMSRNLVHYGNPIFGWNVSNVVVRYDANKLMAPDRAKSRDKIDGVASTLNAIHCLQADAMTDEPPEFQLPLAVEI